MTQESLGLGLVVLGAVVGFALGVAAVYYVVWTVPVSVYSLSGDIRDVRGGALVVGTVAAIMGALVGAGAGIAAEWWPRETRE